VKQVFVQKGNVLLKDVDCPSFSDKEVLVKVFYSFISSGTEAATISISGQSLVQKVTTKLASNIQKISGAIKENGIVGTLGLVKDKMNQLLPLGYSCSGQVVAVGKSVQGIRVGDYVACAGSGIANHAEIVSVPRNLLVKLSDENFLKQTSLTTIGAIAMQGVRRSSLQLGENVCVIGLGLLGQLTVQMAKLAGCRVIAIDLQDARLDLAKKFGADLVLNAGKADVENDIMFATSHQGVDATIITAASSSGTVIQQAMNATRRKGRVVLVGDVKLDFDRDPFYSKEIDFLISCSYGPGRYDDMYEKGGNDYPYAYVRWTENRNMELFVSLVQQGKLDVDSLISQEFGIDQIEMAYAQLQNKDSLGLILSYPQNEKMDFVQNFSYDLSLADYKSYVRPSGRISTAVVGVGGFAKIKLLPLISKNKNVKIDAVIDSLPANAINVAQRYSAAKVGNDYKNILNDENINAVVIATPHVLHAQQSLDFLRAGKAVFVEKPAAVTFEQLENLSNFFKNKPTSLFCVDFNRSFAPMIKRVKDTLKQRQNPMLVSYRMNAGFIPKEHWIQSEANRGRVIGEACHIFDLFCFLTDAKPISVSVHSINHQGSDVLSNDNFVTQFNMSDGSCCSLVYSALGSGKMSKERMEVFFDGKSLVMDDYSSLSGYGLPSSFNVTSKAQDKGHEDLLNKFFDAATKSDCESPIPFERIFLATKMSLVVDKLARVGGGFETF